MKLVQKIIYLEIMLSKYDVRQILIKLYSNQIKLSKGISNISNILREYQKFLIGFYNGGL